MNPAAGMRKYYIGFGVLAVLMLGSVIYTLSSAGAAKSDALTNKTVEQLANKLDTYSYGHDSVPANLAAAGIKDPAPTVEYTKISDSKYKVCLDYKNASSGFDAGWSTLLFGGLLGGGAAYPNDTLQTSSQDSTYFNSSVEFSHKKGKNCQTVTASIYNSMTPSPVYQPAADRGVYTGCSTYSESYPGRRTAKIKSVDTVGHKITIDITYVQNYQDGTGFVGGTAAVTEFTYNSFTSFYDQACNKITDADLSAGERAYFYVTSVSDNLAGQIEVVAAVSPSSQL